MSVPTFEFINFPPGSITIQKTTKPYYVFQVFRFEKSSAMEDFLTTHQLHQCCGLIDGYRIAICYMGSHGMFGDAPTREFLIPHEAMESFPALKTFYQVNCIDGKEKNFRKYKKLKRESRSKRSRTLQKKVQPSVNVDISQRPANAKKGSVPVDTSMAVRERIYTYWSDKIFTQAGWATAASVIRFLRALPENKFVDYSLVAKDIYIERLKNLVQSIEQTGELLKESREMLAPGSIAENWFPREYGALRSSYIEERKQLRKQLELISILFRIK